MSINKENFQKWVDALRSGKYRQGRAYLDFEGRCCCLGVGCRIAEIPRIKIPSSRGDNVFWYGKTSNPHTAPVEFTDWLGVDRQEFGWQGVLPEAVGEALSLVALNDNYGYTFDQIADVIEQQWGPFT